MASTGRGLFSIYIYIENFKNFLVRNHWTNFNIINQKYRTIMFLLIVKFIQILGEYANLYAQVSNIGASWSSCLNMFFIQLYQMCYHNIPKNLDRQAPEQNVASDKGLQHCSVHHFLDASTDSKTNLFMFKF